MTSVGLPEMQAWEVKDRSAASVWKSYSAKKQKKNRVHLSSLAEPHAPLGASPGLDALHIDQTQNESPLQSINMYTHG